MRRTASPANASSSTLLALNRNVHTKAEGQAVDSQGNSTAATLKPIFEQQRVEKELNAQIQITQAF